MVAGIFLVPITEAAAFTVGCAVLQAQARHAERIGVALICTIGVLLLALAMLMTPPDLLDGISVVDLSLYGPPFDDAAAWMNDPVPGAGAHANHG